EVDTARQCGRQGKRGPVPAHPLIVGKALCLPGRIGPDRRPVAVVVAGLVPMALESCVVGIRGELPISLQALVVGRYRRHPPPERLQHLRRMTVAVRDDALLRVGVARMVVEGELDTARMEPADELLWMRNERAPVVAA